nr:O-antigen ligase family protein [Chloroflexota bacterium]
MLALETAVPKFVLVLLVVALGTALALLSWKWAVLLVIGGILLFLILIRPQFALCLLAFAVPFGSIRELPLGPAGISASELLIALLLASWLARMVAARRFWIPRAPLLLPLFLFLGAILLSTLPATSLELSVKEIVKWLEVALLYWFMADMVDERWAQWVVLSLLVAGSAEALVGVYQFLRQVGPEGFILFGRFMRAYGHFAQPNPFAGYLGLTLPLAYALTLEAWSLIRARKTEQVLLGGVSIVAFATMLAAMIMSWSRGGWVGLAAALMVITAVRSRTARGYALVIGLLVAYFLLIGGAQYLPPALVQRVSDFVPYLSGIDVTRVEVTDANWAVVERMAHWLAAVGMFSDHPWLGVGIGNYPVAYPQYTLGRWREALGHAHNYYLNIAAEAGVIGLGAYLLLFGACFTQTWRVIQRLSRPAAGVVAQPEAKKESMLGGSRGSRRPTEIPSEARDDSRAPLQCVREGLTLATPGCSYWRAVALGVLGVLVHLSVHHLFDNLFVHSMNVQLGLLLGLLSVAEKSIEV